MSRNYWRSIIAISVLFFSSCVSLWAVPEDLERAWRIDNILINLTVMSLEATLISLYISKTTYGLDLRTLLSFMAWLTKFRSALKSVSGVVTIGTHYKL